MNACDVPGHDPECECGYREPDEDREHYAALADEMNDPDAPPWVEADWDTDAVAGGKRYAEAHGLRWPPRMGDYDRLYEAEHA